MHFNLQPTRISLWSPAQFHQTPPALHVSLTHPQILVNSQTRFLWPVGPRGTSAARSSQQPQCVEESLPGVAAPALLRSEGLCGRPREPDQVTSCSLIMIYGNLFVLYSHLPQFGPPTKSRNAQVSLCRPVHELAHEASVLQHILYNTDNLGDADGQVPVQEHSGHQQSTAQDGGGWPGGALRRRRQRQPIPLQGERMHPP